MCKLQHWERLVSGEHVANWKKGIRQAVFYSDVFACLHPAFCVHELHTSQEDFMCILFLCFPTFLTYMLVQNDFNVWNVTQLSSQCSAFGQQQQHDLATAEKSSEELLAIMKSGSQTLPCVFPVGLSDTIARRAYVRLDNSRIKFFCGSSLWVENFKKSKLTLQIGTILMSSKEPFSGIQLIVIKNKTQHT